MSETPEKTKPEAPAAAADPKGALEPFERLRDDMLEMANNFWRNGPAEALPWPWGPVGMMRWADPPIDMSETDEDYTITAELAGLAKDDVAVEMDENLLTISGSKEDVHKEKRKHHQYAERRFGSFKRVLSLPPDADVDEVDASFENGVLTVTVPKRPGSAEARTIKVK